MGRFGGKEEWVRVGEEEGAGEGRGKAIGAGRSGEWNGGNMAVGECFGLL